MRSEVKQAFADKKVLCGKTIGEIEEWLTEKELDPGQAFRIATNFYRRRIPDFMSMENLPKSLRIKLDDDFVTGIFRPVKSEKSADNSEKYLFINDRGQSYEAVLLPDRHRTTICVSTQCGCRMGCPFCMTGRSGFRGNLSASDMINQIFALPGSTGINHVVFMGMGEPMDNLEELLKACTIITSEWGLALSPTAVTVSTVGITPAIRQFLERSDCNLAFSLFTPVPSERIIVIPAEKKYPSSEILRIIKEYPARKRRRFTIAYVMISGVNDTDIHLEALCDLLRGSSLRVNLVPYHMLPGDSYEPSGQVRMDHFRKVLSINGISASVRRSRGIDISAACGLLAAGSSADE